MEREKSAEVNSRPKTDISRSLRAERQARSTGPQGEKRLYLGAEGQRQSEILQAEGDRKHLILRAEGFSRP